MDNHGDNSVDKPVTNFVDNKVVKRRQGGFTLLEIMVVILILGFSLGVVSLSVGGDDGAFGEVSLGSADLDSESDVEPGRSFIAVCVFDAGLGAPSQAAASTRGSARRRLTVSACCTRWPHFPNIRNPCQ